MRTRLFHPLYALRLLDRNLQLSLIGASVLVVMGSFVEVLGLGVLIPAIQLILNGDKRGDMKWLPENLQEVEFTIFMVGFLVAIVVVFILKNIFLTISGFYQQRVLFSIATSFSHRLFERYMRMPYEFHLSHSPSLLIRNVQEYSGAIVSNGISPLLSISSDLLTGFGFLALLFWVRPLGTMVMLVVFLICGVALTTFSKKTVVRFGAERLRSRGIALEALTSGFGGVKDIKILGRDSEVIDQHRSSLESAARSSVLFGLVQGLPRSILEIMAVFATVVLVLGVILTGGGIQDASLVLALFGVVTFRMLPAVSRIVYGIQSMNFGRIAICEGIKTLETIEQESAQISTVSSRRTDSFKSLEVVGLSYCYPGSSVQVNRIETFKLVAGESIGIVGSSGSGKSTFVDLLVGLLPPTTGNILVNGQDIAKNLRQWQDRIGYVPQQVYLANASILRNVAFGIPESQINSFAVEQALDAANLLGFVRTLPDGLNTMVGERGINLSGGQRQRLGIARALYGQPEIIVLDEATSALDANTEQEIVDSLNHLTVNRTAITVAHRESTLVGCSRLIRFEQGQIVQQGTFAEIVQSVPRNQ